MTTNSKEVRHAVTLNKSQVDKLLTREGERVTYGEISRGTRTHVSHICKIFNGQRRPSMAVAAKIAGYLGVSMDSLKQALKF